jgi:DNA repair protein RecN (Recombination protein N)
MLVSLAIKNVILIDQLVIEFKNGFCALTGETGAGKSILMDSLGLALGARSDSGLIRKGADQAQVSAEFHIPDSHPVHALLKDSGIESDVSLILRRSIGSDGRSRAFINDQPVSVGLLKQAGEILVEIHGQFETQGLLNPGTHRALLDDYAGTGDTIVALYGHWQKAENHLAVMKASTAQSHIEEQYLRDALQDLDALAPQEGEEATLNALRTRLMNRGHVIEALNSAYEALNAEEDPVRKASTILSRAAVKIGPGAEAVMAALGRASAETQEALAVIGSLSSELEEGGQDIESVDDRLHELRAQARKHNCLVNELPHAREIIAEKLNLIEHGDELLAAQVKATQNARKAYEKEADSISAQRRKAAEKLDKLVQKELPPLKLEKAKFVTTIEKLPEDQWGPYGTDQIRFLVATNPGADPGPLNKIASGGEMARFMLALKVVMAETGAPRCMVFDEVDSGIGGPTADAVGERLARLAARNQILVVTHAPQVAARAAHHWIVMKDGKDTVTTKVIALETAHRREEIARMLSGSSITEEARAAAGKLLESGRAA